MAKADVVALRPYVVVVDVVLEMYLVTMGVTLSFGPFNSLEAASEWCSLFEQERKRIEGQEEIESAKVFEQTGLPTQPFLCAHVTGSDIVQVDTKMRARGELIPLDFAVNDAQRIHISALRALQEALNAAFHSLDNTKDSA